LNTYPNPILGYNEYSIGLHFNNDTNDNDGINDDYNNNDNDHNNYDNDNHNDYDHKDHNVDNDNNCNNNNGDKIHKNQKNHNNNDPKNEINGIEICYSENTFYDPNYDHNNYNTQNIIQNETTIDIIDNIAKGLLSLDSINFPLENSNFSSSFPLNIPSKPQLKLSPPSKPQLKLSPPSKPQLNKLSPPTKSQLNDNKTTLTDSNLTNHNESVKMRYNGSDILSLSPTENIIATNGTSYNPPNLKFNPNPNLNSNSSSLYNDASNSAKPQVDSTTITKPLVPLFISSPSKIPKNNKKNDNVNKRNDKNEGTGNSLTTAMPSSVSAPFPRADIFTPGTDPVTPGTTAGSLPYSLPACLSFQRSDSDNNIEITASTINPLLSISINSTQNQSNISNNITANTDDNINQTKSSTIDILPTHISPAKTSNLRNPDTDTHIFSPISNRYSMLGLEFPANSLIMYGGGYVLMYIYIYA
jgi:hypothetical protein